MACVGLRLKNRLLPRDVARMASASPGSGVRVFCEMGVTLGQDGTAVTRKFRAVEESQLEGPGLG